MPTKPEGLKNCHKIETSWSSMKKTLLEMSDFYDQIKKDPSNTGLTQMYGARVKIFSNKKWCISYLISVSTNNEIIGHLNNFIKDLNIYLDQLKDNKFLIREFVQELFSVANFNYLQHSEPHESWKHLKDKYQEILNTIPLEQAVEDNNNLVHGETLQQMDQRVVVAEKRLKENEVEVEETYKVLDELKNAPLGASTKKERYEEIKRLEDFIAERIVQIKESKHILMKVRRKLDFGDYPFDIRGVIEIFDKVCEEIKKEVKTPEELIIYTSNVDFCRTLFDTDIAPI